MLPLPLAEYGEEQIIERVGGSPKVRTHLENLGFNPGSTVTVVTESMGNVIVKVKEARIALDKEMAMKIMVRA